MRVTLLSIALLLVTPAVHAEDEPATPARRIGLPHASLSLVVPEDWTLTQFDGSIIDLRKDGARLWVHEGQQGDQASRIVTRYTERLKQQGNDTVRLTQWRIRGINDASRAWYDTDTEHRLLGALSREDGSGLSIEALVPRGRRDLLAAIRNMTDSFDANPFEHPHRVVDWSQDWTVDGLAGTGWSAGSRGAGGFVHFAGRHAPERSRKIEVYVRARREGVAPALEHFLARAPFQGVAKVVGLGEDIDGGKEVEVDFTPKKGGQRRLRLRTTKALECAATHTGLKDRAVTEAAMKILRTARAGSDPGPQRDLAKERAPDHFLRDDGPPVTFTLPSRWGMQKPKSNMRLGQFQIPGSPTLYGVAYWFGAGKGGTADQNFTRWRGQFENAKGPPLIEAKHADGIRSTTLDLTGTYVAQVRPGASERVNQPDQRMLASYVEVPQGPIFLKLVGPKAAVTKAAADYHKWLASFRVAKKK